MVTTTEVEKKERDDALGAFLRRRMEGVNGMKNYLKIQADLSEAARCLKAPSVSVKEMIAIVEFFEDDNKMAQVADLMKRRADYVSGFREFEVLSGLRKTLAMYSKSVAFEILEAWGIITYNGDLGNTLGALEVNNAMQNKKIAEIINKLDRKIAGDVAFHLSFIASYLRSGVCVYAAARAVEKEENADQAVKISERLSETARNLVSIKDSSYYNPWIDPTEDNRMTFIYAAEKTGAELKAVRRQASSHT